MKKIFILFLCFNIYYSNISYAGRTDFETPGQTSSKTQIIKKTFSAIGKNAADLINSSHPTISTTLFKLGTATAIQTCSYAIKTSGLLHSLPYIEFPLFCVEMASNLLITNGAADLVQIGFNQYYDAVHLDKSKIKKLTPQEKERRKNDPLYQQNKQELWRRLTIIGRNALNFTNTTVIIVKATRQVLSALTEGINPFAFSYPDKRTCTSFQFLCMPITISIVLPILATFAAYEVYEIYDSKKRSRDKKADIPLVGFISGLMESSAAGLIQQTITSKGILTFPKGTLKKFMMSVLEEYKKDPSFRSPDFSVEITDSIFDNFIPKLAFFMLGSHGTYQMVSNAFQALVINSSYVARRVYSIFKQDNMLILSSTSSENQIQSSRKSRKSYDALAKRASPNQTGMDVNDSFISSHETQYLETLAAVLPKEKQKRHGIADPNKAMRKPVTLAGAESSFNISEPTSHEEREAVRLESLAHIRILKQENSIKLPIINSAINNLLKFLEAHQAFIEVNGHIHTLVINGRRIPYTYESPHDPSNAYEGHKLKRILTLLEIGYIADADPDKIEDLAIQHDIDRLDKVFTFILFNRGQLK